MSRTVTEDGKTKAIRSLDDVEDVNAHKKKQESKRDEALAEDLMYGKQAYKRAVNDTMQERDLKYARLADFYHNKSVEMFWDINPETISKQLFRLKVGKEEVVISAVQLQKYLRWVQGTIRWRHLMTQTEIDKLTQRVIDRRREQEVQQAAEETRVETEKVNQSAALVVMGQTLKDMGNSFQGMSRADQQSSKDINNLLTEIKTSLGTLSTLKSPDMATPIIKALGRLETALRTAVPNITVPIPEVNVAAPKIDLSSIAKILKTDIPQAFEQAIAQVPKPESNEAVANLLNEVLLQLTSIDSATRLKTQAPTKIQVTNPDGSLINNPLPSTPITGQLTIAVTNTAVRLPNITISVGVILQALKGNGTNAFVTGPNGVSTSTGFQLQPGQATSTAVNNLNSIWINGTAGDGICWIGS